MARAAAKTIAAEDRTLSQAQILSALRKFRRGDFTASLPEDMIGTDGAIAEAFNDVVSYNLELKRELERLRKGVGLDGRVGERGHLKDPRGGWQDCIETVNALIGDTVQQTAEISRVISAVAQGDLSQDMALDMDGRPLKGEFLKIARTINTMVERLAMVSSEVTRVAREVGTDGKLGGQAKVKGVGGTWKDLTDNVNAMATNLTTQVRNIAEVTTAVANGNLTEKITVDVKGEILELKNTINTMVDQLNSFASEVTRVAREVGTEGKLGGQARVVGVGGTWKDLTDNVNAMATNLTGQVRNIADVTTAVANGDLTKKITVDVKGEILELKNTINTMVDQLNSFASEVTRVAREVGTEGKLGGQAQVKGVGGTWKDLTDNVNAMATNLTGQVRNIAEVTTAVANGNLTKKITVDVKGEILELKNTINTMVDQLNSFASEVTRVARDVGTEGKLGGEAKVEGVAGTWKDLTDNVNMMATNLTNQVRNIAGVTTAVANGDLSKKITVDARGEILELKSTVNTMVDQLNSFASEVTRVAREVGTEGKLGGQAKVEGVAGTWKDLTDNVNAMATNLTGQVRNIADVTTAVANGDLSKKITVNVQGEILELKDTINTMVDQLSAFAAEVTRVAREVGTEGKLGGQAKVEGVAGTWKDLTDNVNAMATNLTGQVRNIADVTTAVARGDLSKKITVDVKGEILELKNTVNTMVDQLNSFASEVTRVAREVGTEGELGGQAKVEGVAGTWKDLTDNVNAMATNLTGQVRNIAAVTTAVARGDLSKKITVNVKGEILELKDTINTMVDQLSSFAAEVTRVAREVGTEGKLGGQAQVVGVAGTWKDLTDNVNMMATNLTNQVRNIAEVVTAVANGDLKRKLTVDAKGEIAELTETINGMIDTLGIFGDEVTDVAREVGIEGKLGGQAKVPGAAGLWRDLTDNVNQLAQNLTTQVRAIAEVATAVAKGDLTPTIDVDALGEVAALKDNINQMISNLRETTQYNTDQDWLKTNLARFTRMMQGERDLTGVSSLLLSEVAPLVDAQHAVLYLANELEDTKYLELAASYALNERKHLSTTVKWREGLVGQCAYEKERILLTSVPPDYVTIRSGLGEAPPLCIIVLPVLFEDEVLGVIELASFTRFKPNHLSFMEQLVESIGIVFNSIRAGMRTEDLLKQSQMLTRELQSQQEELQDTNDRLEQQAMSLRQSEEKLKHQQDELRNKNEELEEQAQQLQAEKRQVEAINREVETARLSLEEKAEQLALTSKYKSEFLANMSHELRTPLNSLMILSRVLSENRTGNLDEKQRTQAQTIHEAGSELLRLINDILDLSKIESGTVVLDITTLDFPRLGEQIRRNFGELAQEKGLSFEVELEDGLPEAMQTDAQRLTQIINNLLSNAFKFTEKGKVTFKAGRAKERPNFLNPNVAAASGLVAFSISDTGIGISREHQAIVFEAFQQADGTTSRRFGGTGLGLSISRELAQLLGGEIILESEEGAGSTFTLYLPTERVASAALPAPSSQKADAGSIPAPKTPPAEVREANPPAQLDAASPELKPGQPVLLIIEDDPIFAGILSEIAEEQGFSCVVIAFGREMQAAIDRYHPDAISLDIQLPDIGGLTLLEMLRSDPATRHMPVHIVSIVERLEEIEAMSDVMEYSPKPATRERLVEVFARMADRIRRNERRVLMVRNAQDATELEEQLGRVPQIEVDIVAPRKAAEKIAENRADMVVLAARKLTPALRPLLKQALEANGGSASRICVAFVDAPSEADREFLDTLEIPGFVAAEDGARILDAVFSALQIPAVDAAPEIVDQIGSAVARDGNISGHMVGVVDDDVRNIFSLTAVLEGQGLNVVYAENGRDGVALLDDHPEIDIMLIDIMMPEMDGYETMQAIRQRPDGAGLPLIAVTAKAMPEDRAKCLEAGATDYLAKPVDIDELLAMLRTHLRGTRATKSKN